jgi:hypothetical protein
MSTLHRCIVTREASTYSEEGKAYIEVLRLEVGYVCTVVSMEPHPLGLQVFVDVEYDPKAKDQNFVRIVHCDQVEHDPTMF